VQQCPIVTTETGLKPNTHQPTGTEKMRDFWTFVSDAFGRMMKRLAGEFVG
jgi:hypothetical protein